MCDNLPCLPEGTEIVLNYPNNLAWYEYVIFAVVLIGSLGIGVFYGCFGTKNRTNEEFLMAGRSMSILPVSFHNNFTTINWPQFLHLLNMLQVTLSLVSSFVSAITLLGNPVEVYFYGQQYTWMFFAYIPMTAVLAYLYVPVYFDLQLTSAYEV